MIRSLFLLTFLLSLTLSAQITSETIASSVLGKSRTIDLYVPEMKEGAVDPLPLIVVFEGQERIHGPQHHMILATEKARSL